MKTSEEVEKALNPERHNDEIDGMWPHPQGRWVLYENIEVLKAEIERLQQRIKELV